MKTDNTFNKEEWKDFFNGETVEDDTIDKASSRALAMIEEGNKIQYFRKMAECDYYFQRGFIKEGELVAHAEDLLGLKGFNEEFVQDNNGMNVTKYPDAYYIVGMDADCDIDESELEENLLKIHVSDKFRSSYDRANFYVFRLFEEEEGASKIHGNKYVEFLSHYIFIKAAHGWVLLRKERSVLLPCKYDWKLSE